jgi:hypothetical protein
MKPLYSLYTNLKTFVLQTDIIVFADHKLITTNTKLLSIG